MARCATCQAELRAGAPFCAQCGAAFTDPDVTPADRLLGSVLAGKFRVHSVLGEGGMGKVYKAEQVPLGTDVVIKVLHGPLAADPMLVKRFFREAQAASRLRHPNGVGVLDFGDANGTLYIAMEFLRGRTLSQVLAQEGRFEPKRAVRVIDQVLDVLEAAHRMSIVHRDLKPDNIMVEDLPTQRDFVKVLDFGIAKIVERDGGTKLTQTGMIFGTPQYMAPEQASGDAVDGRSDLYAVGTILFELLVGHVPFRTGSLAMLLADVVTKPAPAIASLRADVPTKLAAIVDRALAKEPERRPQGALEMKRELEDAIADTLVGVPAEGTRPCPSCGHLLPIVAKFCGECGASTVLAAAAAAQDQFADLRRFLKTGVVDELAQMKSRAAGERRELVVAVFDFGGAAVAGDDSARVLAELHAELGAIAARRGGAFEHHAGGGATLTFGLHALHADDAERAVAAALDARDAISKLHAEIEATCAIHGGAAVVEGGGRYAPVGDTVELATRLAATVSAGKVVVSERVHAALRDRVVVRPMEAVRLKGRAAAVPIYEVTAMRAATESHAGLARPPTVGRDALLDALARAADDAKAGRAIVLAGEPGSGKTRALEELAARRAAKRALAIELHPHGRGSRVEPALRRLALALGGGADGYRALGLPAADGRLLVRYFEGGGGRDGLGEAEERLSLVGALRAGIELLGERVPVMLLVDDLHLAEPVTSALVARCVTEAMPGVTTVVTVRPGYPMPWDGPRAAAAGLQAISLAPLPDDAIAQLVAGALAPTPAPRELAAAIAARAGGSPLLALESLRALVDRGVVRAIGGRWTVSGDLASASAPAGLRELFAARIDALPGRARDVLACLAIVGEALAVDQLRAVCDQLGGAGIDRDLDLLVARGLVVRREDGTLRVAESSAREVVIERLGEPERARVHLAIARALEAMPEREVGDEIVADHFRAGGEATAALAWYARAADDAHRARQRQRAAAVVQKAREVARAQGAASRRYADDSLRLGELLLELGDLPAAKTVAAEGVAAAHAIDDPDLIARMRRLRGRALSAAGELDAAMPELEAALTGALDARNKIMIAELHADLGEAHEKRGDLAKALELMMSALELAQGSASGDLRRLALRLMTGIGRVCVRKKELDRAHKFLQQGLELAQAIDDQLGAAKVLGNLAGVYHARGDFTTAIAFVRRALDLSRELGDLVGVTRQLSNLGTLYVALGDHAGAASSYDSAFAAAQRCGWREGMAAAAAAKARLPG